MVLATVWLFCCSRNEVMVGAFGKRNAVGRIDNGKRRKEIIMAETMDLFRQWQNGEISEDEYRDKVAEIMMAMGVRL